MYFYRICAGCKYDEPDGDKTKCCECKNYYVDTDEEKYESLPDKYEIY